MVKHSFFLWSEFLPWLAVAALNFVSGTTAAHFSRAQPFLMP